MSSVPAVNNAALNPTTRRPAATGVGSATMDKDAFLKLLTAQMKYQDPLKPADQTQQLAQLAQFSSLEQMTNLTTQLKAMVQHAQADRAVGLVGKEVTYRDEAGADVTGPVQKVTFTEAGAARVTVGGVDGIDPAKITVVR